MRVCNHFRRMWRGWWSRLKPQVIYTLLGQKYYQGDPDVGRRCWSPRDRGSFTWCTQRAGSTATLHPHHTGSKEGRQDVSSPSQRRGLEGQTFFFPPSVCVLLNSKVMSHVLCVTHRAPQLPKNSRDCICQVLKDQECRALWPLAKHWLAAGSPPPPSPYFPMHHPRLHHKLPSILGSC